MQEGIEEKKWRKVNSKRYQILIDEEWQVIDCPYLKVENIVQIFIGNGGMINPISGEVETDPITLISSFKTVGNALLTEHDKEGNVTKEGNCSMLSYEDLPVLFEIAVDIISGFIGLVVKTNQKEQTLQEQNQNAPEKTKKTKTA